MNYFFFVKMGTSQGLPYPYTYECYFNISCITNHPTNLFYATVSKYWALPLDNTISHLDLKGFRLVTKKTIMIPKPRRKNVSSNWIWDSKFWTQVSNVFFVAEMAVATASGSRTRRLERAAVQGLRQDLQVAEKPLSSFGNLASGEQIILSRLMWSLFGTDLN